MKVIRHHNYGKYNESMPGEDNITNDFFYSCFFELDNGKKLSNKQEIEILNINHQHSKKKLNYINTKIEKIRIIKGTNFDYFSNLAKEKFLSENFLVTKLADRMGIRLKGLKIEKELKIFLLIDLKKKDEIKQLSNNLTNFLIPSFLIL